MTPFLGAGANLCGRPRDYSWYPGDGYFPSGAELALHLAERFGYEGDDAQDLMAVATYAEVMHGASPLYGELRDIFDRPTPLRRRYTNFSRGAQSSFERGIATGRHH